MAGHRLKDEGERWGIVLTQLPTYSFDVELCSMVWSTLSLSGQQNNILSRILAVHPSEKPIPTLS